MQAESKQWWYTIYLKKTIRKLEVSEIRWERENENAKHISFGTQSSDLVGWCAMDTNEESKNKNAKLIATEKNGSKQNIWLMN